MKHSKMNIFSNHPSSIWIDISFLQKDSQKKIFTFPIQKMLPLQNDTKIKTIGCTLKKLHGY